MAGPAGGAGNKARANQDSAECLASVRLRSSFEKLRAAPSIPESQIVFPGAIVAVSPFCETQNLFGPIVLAATIPFHCDSRCRFLSCAFLHD